MCCTANEDLHDEGRPLSLYTDTYDDIWNSAYMRDARRAMAHGEKVSSCQRCYDEEDSVGASRRTLQNLNWQAESREARKKLVESARWNRWRVSQKPSFLQLNMGNLCNLACRMCSSQYSSRIESDTVHNKWVPADYPVVARWQGQRLRIGPRQYFGVSFTGFYQYEALPDQSIRWCSGSGTIKVRNLEGTEIEALHLSLQPVRGWLPGTIRINGSEVFQGTFEPQWTRRFELAGTGKNLVIEIDTDTQSIDDRPLGVALLEAWIERKDTPGATLANTCALTRYATGESWWAQPEIMLGELLGQPDRMKCVIFQGGEPFLVKEFEDILDFLISSGAAGEVTFQIISNLTTIKESMISKLAQLKQVLISASIEGIGPIQEYVRYPSVWNEIERNLDRVLALPNGVVSFATAVQAYNLGGVVDILSYCDQRGIDVYMNFLVGPLQLNVAVLPQQVRSDVVERVETYLGSETVRPANRIAAEFVIRHLREHLHIQYRDHFPTFVRFTNDMDVSRGQSFRAVYPHLMESFAKDGLVWTDETQFAERASAA
jgi:glutamate-1-semialdehyde 2,1-aminomutase